MTIAELIRKSFPGGIEYDDAVRLCLHLYCVKALPDELMPQCTKENLPIAFAELVAAGAIDVGETPIAVMCGVSGRDLRDKGHWGEVIASISKMLDPRIDWDRGAELAARLREQCYSDVGIVSPALEHGKQ